MKTVILNQSPKLAFYYDGYVNEDLLELIKLDVAFISNEEPLNNTLFVKIGEYKKDGCIINKYVNVPKDYWLVIENYTQDPTSKEIEYIKNIRILSDSSFRNKYLMIKDENYLFDIEDIVNNGDANNE